MSDKVKCNFCNCDVERSDWDSHVEDSIHLTNVRVYNSVVVEPTKKSSGGEIGTYAVSLLRDPELANKTYVELAEMVRDEFGSKTSAVCMAWYSSHHKLDKTIIKRQRKSSKKVEIPVQDPNEVANLAEVNVVVIPKPEISLEVDGKIVKVA